MSDIEKTLKDLNIDFVLHEHPPVFTCEEAEKYRTLKNSWNGAKMRSNL